MDLDSTMFFRADNTKENATQEILNTVYGALVEKGYDPISQIVGYILSGDPAYITSQIGELINYYKDVSFCLEGDY